MSHARQAITATPTSVAPGFTCGHDATPKIISGKWKPLMSILTDADSRAIFGAAIPGTGGDEAIHSALDPMAANCSIDVLARTMHIPPTVSEFLPTIAGDLEPAR